MNFSSECDLWFIPSSSIPESVAGLNDSYFQIVIRLLAAREVIFFCSSSKSG